MWPLENNFVGAARNDSQRSTAVFGDIYGSHDGLGQQLLNRFDSFFRPFSVPSVSSCELSVSTDRILFNHVTIFIRAPYSF